MEHFWIHVCFSLLLLVAGKIKVGGAKERKPANDDFVRVHVPAYVNEGKTVFLKCTYDVDNDRLYSMKWYKGSQEFFRFTPKESPPIKTFPLFGGKVDLKRSNFTDVALTSVDLNMTDKYTCEVTKDFPDYTTSLKAGKMTVVALPEHKPLIISARKSVSIGDTLNVNCTSFRSNPVANISWLLNTFPVRPHYLTPPLTIRDKDNKETVTIGLNFTVRQHNFIRKRMTITCHARIEPGLYSEFAEMVILENEHPDEYSSAIGNYTSLSSETRGKSPDSEHIISSGSSSTIPASVTAAALMQLYFQFIFISLPSVAVGDFTIISNSL